MNKETIRELRERADGMITAGIADSRVRSCVHDIEFDFVRRDGRHDVQDVINLELDRRTAADEMPHVTPDTVVKCPECGATFRVGKALVQTKGEAASRRLFKTEVPLPTSGEDAASPLRNTRKRKETEMKLKIDWKTLGRMIWDAVKPVLLAAIGGGVVSLTGGCSSLQPATKSQSMTVTALGFPAITVVTTTSQSATNDGDDEGENTQTTSADVKPDIDASVVPK